MHAALAEVERLKAELGRRERLLHDLPEQEGRLLQAERAHEDAGIEAVEARRRVEAVEARIGTARDVLRLVDDELGRLRGGIIASLLARLGNAGARRDALRRAELDERRRAAADRLADALGSIDGIRDAREGTERLAAAARADEEVARRALEQARAAVEAIGAAHGRVRGVAQTLALPYEQRHQRLPGSSDTLDQARAAVFVKALRVHQTFIAGARSAVRRNLNGALGMISGRLSPSAAVTLDLWGTLALIVPVLSSTFSSFKRCFDTVPAGGLDWLVVDEAGQAVPQHAVGALIVGDPLQVEPVITLDRSVDERLLHRWSAAPEHLLTATSLQVLADAANPVGTWIASDAGRTWVGSPLVVHRRCVEPMVSISNDLAYADAMVLGDGKPEEEAALTVASPLLGASCWVHLLTEAGGEGHHMEAHAAMVAEIVRAFVVAGLAPRPDIPGMPDVYAISPFRSARAGGAARAGVPGLGRAAQGCFRALARAVGGHRAHVLGQGGRGGRAAARRAHRGRHRVGGRHAERAQRRGDAGAPAPLRGRRPGRVVARRASPSAWGRAGC